MSSLHCPQCQSPLEQDFGVISCGRCGAVLMVDIEGNIQLSEGGPSSYAPPASVPEDVSAFLPPEEVHALEGVSEEGHESAMSEPPSFEPEPEVEAPILNTYGVDAAADTTNFKEEIINFGNSDLHTGPLSYTLTISKIDSGELRGFLRNVLSDPKFNLDVDDLFSSIRAGCLVIENLNPIKTSLLVQRLRPQPFQISWRQNVFSA